MLKRFLLIVTLALAPLMSSAQKTVTASGTYIHYAPMNVTPDQAELTAIERAKIDIIEKEYGRVVGVNNYTEVINEGVQSSVKFLSLGESEVKGEWIETIGKPVIKHEFANNLQVITVSIAGRIREVKVAKVDFDAKILRNGVADRFESSEFRDGDDFFVSFQAPIDGYVAIYLYDLSGVNRLLPMKYSGHPAYYVSADTKYVFFADGVSLYDDIVSKNQNAIHSDYGLTCEGDSEVNRIYIIFSPNKFTTASDDIPDETTAPASIDFDGFQKWLSRCRRRDKDMGLRIRDVVIRNQ